MQEFGIIYKISGDRSQIEKEVSLLMHKHHVTEIDKKLWNGDSIALRVKCTFYDALMFTKSLTLSGNQFTVL